MAYDDPDPKKDLARQATYNAIRRGELVRSLVCEMCGDETKTHAHHNDYDKPLDVNWLCAGCHKDVHRKLGGLFYYFDFSQAVTAASLILI